jgi:hypothetical protein
VPLVIVANRWQRKWDIVSQEYLLVVEQWNKETEARLDYEEHFEGLRPAAPPLHGGFVVHANVDRR